METGTPAFFSMDRAAPFKRYSFSPVSYPHLDREAAEQSFQQALAEYFQEIAMQSSEVKINAVGSILMNTEGIIDYSELKLNGDTANVAIADGAVPVVGEVTLHAVT